MAERIEGQPIRDAILEAVAIEIRDLEAKPALRIVMVGDDPPSHVYTKRKLDACLEVGIDCTVELLPGTSSQEKVQDTVAKACSDRNIDGVLVQLPLPAHIDRHMVVSEIWAAKDVDGICATNLGKLAMGTPGLRPCTALAVIEILRRSGIETRGTHIGIVGRSILLGSPLATMLAQNSANGNSTVTVCHEHTLGIASILGGHRQGGECFGGCDVIVSAVGKTNFRLTADMVRPGAVVIDVAIRRDGTSMIGDVDASVWDVASKVTPVPGGVGPVTVACVVRNTLEAWKGRRPLKENLRKSEDA